MPKTTIVITDSSMLTKAVFDQEEQTLEVTFKNGGKQYRYHPVTMDMFSEFDKAQSRGSFFLKHIRAKEGITATSLGKRAPLPGETEESA